MSTYVPIQTITLGSNSATVDFTGIPQTFTDFVLVGNFTTNQSAPFRLLVGNNTIDTAANYSMTQMAGTGSVTESTRSSNANFIASGYINAAGRSIWQMHFMNYANTTTNKTVLIRYSTDVSASQSANARVGLWRSTSAINCIRLETNASPQVFESGSTFTLYGIGSGSPKAFGGDRVVTDGTYWYHVFTSSGRFEPVTNLSCDVLAIGGGGGSGNGTNVGGGGGAGGLLYATSKSFAGNTNFVVTVGAGGGPDASGVSTTIDNITAFGGGRGGDEATVGGSGGSGGGSTWASSFNTPGTSTQTNNGGGTGYGNAGGSNTVGAGSNHYPSGGGGGAGAVGGNGTAALQGGNGGAGLGGNTLAALNAFGAATSTGVLSGGNYYYAGGGGGGSWLGSSTWSSGGVGGGGRGGANIAGGDNPADGVANTGGGGGGNGAAAVSGRSGGSGIVIVRYAV